MGKFKKNKNDKEIKLKEYIKEYSKICQTITEDMLYCKEIIIEYDECIPDMFVKIPIKDNEYIDEVLYDIYNKRLKEVYLRFPNNEYEICKVVGEIDKIIYDDFCEITWQEPLIELSFYNIKVSIYDLIAQGVRVYLTNYDLKGIDISGE